MTWQDLHSIDQLSEIDRISRQGKGVMIFKHSTRCPVSSMALHRLKSAGSGQMPNFPVYYLNLIAHRDVSNQVASHYGITHQSPQVLLIKNGQCVYDTSHTAIRLSTIEEVWNE